MKSHIRTTQQGFTLIELVVVIVIIGILAAFAIPRFSNIATDARISSVNGLLGSIRSTSALVHGLALARQTVDGDTIDLEGSAVKIKFAYPTAGVTLEGIELALSTTDGYNKTYVVGPPGVTTFAVAGATDPLKCFVSYTEPASAGAAPIIASDSTDC